MFCVKPSSPSATAQKNKFLIIFYFKSKTLSWLTEFLILYFNLFVVIFLLLVACYVIIFPNFNFSSLRFRPFLNCLEPFFFFEVFCCFIILPFLLLDFFRFFGILVGRDLFWAFILDKLDILLLK